MYQNKFPRKLMKYDCIDVMYYRPLKHDMCTFFLIFQVKFNILGEHVNY